MSAAQSIPGTGIPTNVQFDSELWDPNNMHDNAVNNERITPGVAGYYLACCGFQWAISTAGTYRFLTLSSSIGILRQDIKTSFLAGSFVWQEASAIVYLGATDYVYCWVSQNTGGPLDIAPSGSGTSGYRGCLELQRIA